MVRIQFIKRPTAKTVELLCRRMSIRGRERIEGKGWDAVGLVQSDLPRLFAFADVAEKKADVIVEEIQGVCPQHFTMIGIFGDTAAVEAALSAIQGIGEAIA